jgi:hypothetical protein
MTTLSAKSPNTHHNIPKLQPCLLQATSHIPHLYTCNITRLPPCLVMQQAILHISIRLLLQGFDHVCFNHAEPYSTVVFVYGQYYKDSAMLASGRLGIRGRAILHTRICIRPIGFRHACFGAAPYSTLVFVYDQ